MYDNALGQISPTQVAGLRGQYIRDDDLDPRGDEVLGQGASVGHTEALLFSPVTSLLRSGPTSDNELAHVIHVDERTFLSTFCEYPRGHALSHSRATGEDQGSTSHRFSKG